MNPNCTVVSSSDGDWEALYLDGIKTVEGHSLRPRDIFEALGVQVEFREIQSPVDIEGEIDFAQRLEDVRFEPYRELTEAELEG